MAGDAERARRGLYLANEEVADVLARSDADGVVEGPEVERGRKGISEAEGKHERDPS